jgi:hypothetical protein
MALLRDRIQGQGQFSIYFHAREEKTKEKVG